MKDCLITDLSPLPKANLNMILIETITMQIGRLALPFPCSSVSEDGCKTGEEFIEDTIVHNNSRKIPNCLSPEERHQALLNCIDISHRFVFRQWPRPHAVIDFNKPEISHPVIKPENSLPGKTTPNGVQLWGSTLFDFFGVQRVAGLVYQRSLSTGSKLLRWCKENGEYEGKNRVAGECIEWAEGEKDPEIIPVYNVANLIKSVENSAFPMIDFSKIQVQDTVMQVDADSDADSDANSDEESIEEDSASPQPSAFASAAYFGLPFSKTGPWRYESLPVLEEYIPQARLPRKLIVHDHWSLLRVRSSSESLHRTCVSWAEQARDTPHRVRTYRLKSSSSSADEPEARHHRRREYDDEKELRQKEVGQNRILDDFLANPHSSTTPRPFGMEIYEQQQPTGVPIKPAIYVVVPPRPPLAAASEAHLYLSPTQYIGKGNHSFVYGAEWELPRSCLVEERICIECIMEDVEAILREQDGESGETRDKKWDELTGMLVVKRTVKEPFEVMMSGPGGEEGPPLNSNTYVLRKGEKSTEIVYEGPYRVIHTRIRYQTLGRAPYCEHLRNSRLPDSIHPLTTKVRVTAKLSIKYDTHLAQEARNYQHFPKHFFEHWSGYNILPPIHDPVPLGPLVPQFYGYYVSTGDPNQEGYLSPILLLEDCGVPIQPSSLSVDDKNECAGLGLRLHEANWFHGSFSQRNILRKPGPLSAHPEERDANRRKRGGYGVEWSFRLIDFGRSKYDENWSGLDTEHQLVRNWGTGLIEKSALG